MELSFEKAFQEYILHQKVVSWGFQLITRARQANGYWREYGGYFTLYENGYKLVISGESLGKTPIQEALIIAPDGTPIARDTEDLKYSINDETD